MANTPDPMDIKQIITLHPDGSCKHAIGKTLGISRNTGISGAEYSFYYALLAGLKNIRLKSCLSLNLLNLSSDKSPASLKKISSLF